MNQYIDDIPAHFAESAYNCTSFSPERRGAQIRREYADKIARFHDFLLSVMGEEHAHLIKEELERYRARTKQLYMDYLSSHSRLASAFIVGPARFPVARMQKRENATHNKLNALVEHEEKAMKAISRKYGKRPDNAPIMSGDADAVERLQKKLDGCKKLQERMKAANAAIRKAKGDNAKATASLVELGFSEKTVSELLKGDFCGRIGFPSYALTNNNAEIRRLEKRLAEVSAKQALASEESESEDGVRVEVDNAANRVRVYFPDKPDADTRAALKSHGFRWSPRNGAWQAYINRRSTEHAKSYLAA